MYMRIRELREQNKMTQSDLATSMGVVRNAVTNWETEVTLPKVRQLPLLASVLCTSIDELFTEEAKAVLPCENHITEMGA